MHGRTRKSDRRPWLRFIGLLILTLISTTPSAAGTEAWSVDRLMQILAGVEQRESRFVETRQIALLEQTLTASGRLSFQQPDRLSKAFDPPGGLHYEIEANRLQIHRPDGSRETLRLDNAPRLLAYVAAMRSVLAGDSGQLQDYFELHLDGQPEAWQLRLTPIEPGLASQVRHIEIEGAGSHVSLFRILEQSGDLTTTRLQQPDEE